MAEMKLKDYEHHFEARGIYLPPHLLHRFKKIIFHLEHTEDYLRKRLAEDRSWWADAVSGSPRGAVLANQGVDLDKIIAEARDALTSALAQAQERDRAVQLAGWLDNWLGSYGLTRLRNSLNTRLHTLNDGEAERLVRMPIMSSTRDRLNRLIEHSGGQLTYDEMLNQVLAFYAQMHNIDLAAPKKRGGRKAGRISGRL